MPSRRPLAFAFGAASLVGCSLLTSPTDYRAKPDAAVIDPADASVDAVDSDEGAPGPAGQGVLLLSGVRDPIPALGQTDATPVADGWTAVVRDGGTLSLELGPSVLLPGFYNGSLLDGTLRLVGYGQRIITATEVLVVQWAPLAEGRVGEFTTARIAKPPILPRYFTQSAGFTCVGSFAFLVGGLAETDAGSVASGDVYRFPMADLNVLPTVQWERQSSTLNVPRSDAAVVVAGGFMYAIGGSTGTTTASAEVEVASIDAATGVLGPFRTLAPLEFAGKPRPLDAVTATAVGGRLYVLGGLPAPDLGSDVINATVLFADILGDGSLSPWRVTEAMPDRVRFPSVFSSSGRLFLAGGRRGSTERSRKVYGTTIRADGALDPWAEVASLGAAGRHGMAVIPLPQ